MPFRHLPEEEDVGLALPGNADPVGRSQAPSLPRSLPSEGVIAPGMPGGTLRSQGRDHGAQLDLFFAQGLITEVLGLIKIGKEASVYCCRAGAELGMDLVAAKVFRQRQYRFKNDAVYQEGRTREMRGRQRRAFEKMTDFGRRVQTGTWIQHEFETLQVLHQAGADVPRPLASKGDAILMEYIGDEEEPAPRLAQVDLEPSEAEPLFQRLMANVELWLASNRVHGDLSAHNILYWQGKVTVIDFPQAVDPRFNGSARNLLQRDIENLWRCFAPYGIDGSPLLLVEDLWQRFLRAEL